MRKTTLNALYNNGITLNRILLPTGAPTNKD